MADARLFRPGVLRCAKCGFRLVSNWLNASDGTVSPRETTEHCPNDGAPMWRVTWEEECRESDKCWEQQVERAVAAEAALAAALKALEPFAEASEHLHPYIADDGVTLDGIKVSAWREAWRACRGGS